MNDELLTDWSKAYGFTTDAIDLLTEIHDAMEVAYDYATDTGEEPWNGAHHQMERIKKLIQRGEEIKAQSR